MVLFPSKNEPLSEASIEDVSFMFALTALDICAHLHNNGRVVWASISCPFSRARIGQKSVAGARGTRLRAPHGLCILTHV